MFGSAEEASQYAIEHNLTGATISYNSGRGYWEVGSGGLSFWRNSRGVIWMAYSTNEGVFFIAVSGGGGATSNGGSSGSNSSGSSGNGAGSNSGNGYGGGSGSGGSSGSGSGGGVNYNGYKIPSEDLKIKLKQFALLIQKNVIVTSGYRSAARNAAAGGAKSSRHMTGDGVDIKVQGLNNRTLSILAHNSGIFNTVIYYPEMNVHGALRPHVHLDLNPTHNNMFLIYDGPTIKNGKVTKQNYSPFKL